MAAQLLVVDDERNIREMLSRHYRLKEHEVAVAANGKEALEYLSRHRVDLVISDIRMPEMDGVELLRRIRVEYPMTRVLIITGYVTLENALACMRKGADNCVFKPLSDLEELDDAVEMSLQMLRNWKNKLRELRGMKPAGEGEGA